MRAFFLLLLLLLGISSKISSEERSVDPSQKALSYYAESRLGNQLITYLCAKWIAHQNQLPFLYVPFPYADQFVFHERETHYLSDWQAQFQNQTYIKKESEISQLPDSSLILINFFQTKFPTMRFRQYWNNPKFRTMMRSLIQPRFPIQTISLPEDKLTILLHVRTGGGYDSEETKLRYPNKFPPHSFFISAIEILSEIFGHPPIYAHIMTDDLNPESIAQEYRHSLAKLKNVDFGYRKGDNGPSANVLEDFFSVQKFGCIVRGSSTFTIAASLPADFDAEVTPKCSVKNGKVVVDEIRVQQGNARIHYKNRL